VPPRRPLFGAPKREATVEMMPLTCAPLGMGVVNRMIGCREPAVGGHYRGGEWWWQIGSSQQGRRRRRPFSGCIRLTPDGLP